MKNKIESRSHSSQIFALVALLAFVTEVTTADRTDENQTSEILVKRFSGTNSSGGVVPKILKVTQGGFEEVVHVPHQPLFTMKSDPVKVQSDFKTVDISVLNRQRDKERAKKVAIIQQDLQSRVKFNEPVTESKEPVEEIIEVEPVDPEEVLKKQARVKEDIESRLLLDDGFLGYRQEKDHEVLHYPVKRSDDDYYADEPMPDTPQMRSTTESAKEDSFFSIFESLFGSSDDDSQTKKKSKPEEDLLFKDPEDANMKENIKTVGDILKPLKPVDEPEAKTQNVFAGYQSDAPEYRIVNNFHSSQAHKQGYKPPEPKPSYHNFYRPTEKPFRPYKPHSTNGYEDYDLEEFLDKDSTMRVKYVSPVVTTPLVHTEPPTTTSTTATTTTTMKQTTKNVYENKLKFPSVQKKNDYINRNRYQEVKNEVTEKKPEKVTDRPTYPTTYHKPEIKTTTENTYSSKPTGKYETKVNEVKPQKIQESPNFYNLINLPVRYSTKDTAIPLISTSYANTKIQGMGALKYEKGANGKYPNHKYDQVNTSTTKKPDYWATKRTSTEQTTTSFRPSPVIYKTTTKYAPSTDLSKVDYNEMTLGWGTEFGGYGAKTGVEVKTQAPTKQTSTTSFYKETTTAKSDDVKVEPQVPQQTSFKPNSENGKIKEVEKSTVKPEKDIYEDYEYESFPAQVQEVKPSTTNKNYPPQVSFINNNQQVKNELEYKKQQQANEYKTSTQEPAKPPEVSEYEYYEYDVDMSTTTTTTTTTAASTPKYKIKYPSLPKEKIKTSNSEKVAVVVASKDHDFYENQSSNENTRTSIVTSPPGTSPSTTSTTTTSTPSPKPTETTSKVTKPQLTSHFKKPTTHYYKSNQFHKEPAPVFEEVEEQGEYTTKQMTVLTTKKTTSEKPATAESTVKPVIVTSSTKDSENKESNVNIVLVSSKGATKNGETEEKYSYSERPPPSPPSPGPVHKRPGQHPYPTNYDYTTEFTVGVVHGHGGNSVPQAHGNGPSGQGHFVASSISTNPYGDDEPFRPIAKPPGMTSSFQVVHEEAQRQPPKNPQHFQNKRPIPTPPSLQESEPIHEPHDFIPSPQFHRPVVDPKPPAEVRPGATYVDYDFEGIQTEPKPGQYVMFSKPQLNPEMNENQLKKKPEVSAPTKVVSNVPHFHEKVNHFEQESQKHVVFSPKDGQFYQSSGKPFPSDKAEANRPVFGNIPELNDDRLSLQLVPPRGTQTEKPFEGNFVAPETEKKESTVSYPRPHWEKNGKPSFLLNTLQNKNDLHGSRLPPLPPQMAPTLIPPSSVPPQRFRRPLQPHIPPMRKNFNEAGTNVKPKPNLPNILPQFRPNAKVGRGPYQRPPGFIGSNRRNGMNRFHEKEHGNFPYHIQHPDKDILMHREYDMGTEIVPKFITNRGKLPSELWNSQGLQKRFGEEPINMRPKEFLNPGGENQGQKILRRMQRTPVTTLQMLKQMPRIKTQKTQVTREDSADPSAPLVPPIYRTYVDPPKSEENLYIVYPSKAPQKLQPDSKVFVVSDTKSQKNFYNYTKVESQHPLLNTNKRVNAFGDKPKNDFPYGFIKPNDKLHQNKKEPEKVIEENVRKNVKTDATKESQGHDQELKVFPVSIPTEKDEKIDMNLHMQSNNQWNEVKTSPDSLISIQKVRNDHYRFSEYPSGDSQKQSEKNGIRLDPPSEYHTSIKDENDSAFTLGAVMHTMPEGNRRGQVASVSLHNDEKNVNIPKLNVNERISNGKIVTVSMPLDVKQDSNEESDSDRYQFQAPFQASSSITSNESHSINQGWSIVTNPDEKTDTEDGKETTETSTSPHFSFENFKPELIGGFKPIYELPEELAQSEETKEQKKPTDREERKRSSS